ncbi:MAG: ABC-type lipoprotein export system ATPase subunit [Candidatus Saccharimonadales bacterium]|jgi:ABC-type lipoprotein export system ATPase subunit
MPIIEIEEVSKLYGFGDATTVALDGVSLSIDKGEFIAVMGPSGSGKTTLMNLIGLLDKPTHGTYKLNSRNVSRLPKLRLAKIRRDNIGFIFQSFNLISKLTAVENVALPLAYKGMRQSKRLKTADNVLKQVGLEDRDSYLPSQLSGGQMQRVSIARALVNNPNIIIADEPTGNLDSVSARVVMELLSDIHKLGNTVVMVTHNPSLTRYADRIIYMLDGTIVYDEASTVGEIPTRIKNAIEALRKSNDDEKLANVSAMMEEMPEVIPAKKSKRRKGRKKNSKRKNSKRAKLSRGTNPKKPGAK